VVTELSRMSRSLPHLLALVAEFAQPDIALISLREHIDTTTATGRCFLAIMGAIAQMERELKAERTAAGRAAAKARGRTGGRPRTDPDKLEHARILYLNSRKSAADVCQTVGIGVPVQSMQKVPISLRCKIKDLDECINRLSK
jgi:DNA invertase Pin-like site-specific DNA recombinase